MRSAWHLVILALSACALTNTSADAERENRRMWSMFSGVYCFSSAEEQFLIDELLHP